MNSVWSVSILSMAVAGVVSLSRGGISRNAEPKYLPELVLSAMGMMDEDKDGVISFPEAEDFLAAEGVPRGIRTAFSASARRSVDFNHNDKLEKTEIRQLLQSLLAGSQWPDAVAAQIVALETERMVDAGEIPLPDTPKAAGDALVSILDADDSDTVSLEEAHAFYRVATTEDFWRQLLKTVEMVDTNDDKQLDQQEATEWYLLTEKLFGPTSFEPLLTYGRIVDILGQYPDVIGEYPDPTQYGD